MTEKKRNGAHNETVCTKASAEQRKALKRLARQKKQTVSKTLNDLLTRGLAIRRPKSIRQGTIPPGE
jgi:predicted transcriptional regulator